METISFGSFSALSVIFISILIWAWSWLLNWIWFRPKKLEKLLKQQGLAGKPYPLFFGDSRETSVMLKQTKSRSIALSDDVSERIIPIVYHTVKNYGKNSFIWVGTIPSVVIMNPEHIRDIFMKMDEFRKPITFPLRKLIACGLASHEGAKWAKHRKIITPAFQLDKLKLMVPAFYQSSSDMINKWEELVNKEGSCELDVWPYLQSMTSDAISRTAFGSSFEEGKRIFELLEQLAHLILQHAHSVHIPGFLPTKTNKRIKELNEEIQGLLKGIIKKRERAMEAAAGQFGVNDDLLGILMESNLRETQEHGHNRNAGMSIEDVIEECKVFYFAGHETTSNLLAWTMVLLSKYPNWQQRAREEVLQVFGNKKQDYEGLNQLKVVTMILYEVLRFYPPAAIIHKTVHKETKLGNLLLPAGVQVSLPTILVHKDHELWGEDASEFKPERFAQGVSKATKNQVSFFPFGWGPRICIGQNFAMIEVKIALAKILQHFSFDISPSYTHAPQIVITLRPQYGAHLVLHKIWQQENR